MHPLRHAEAQSLYMYRESLLMLRWFHLTILEIRHHNVARTKTDSRLLVVGIFDCLRLCKAAWAASVYDAHAAASRAVEAPVQASSVTGEAGMAAGINIHVRIRGSPRLTNWSNIVDVQGAIEETVGC